MDKFRKRLFEIVQIGGANDAISRFFDIAITVIILLNISVSFLDTFDALSAFQPVFKVTELVTVILFTIEYICRLITADFLYPKNKKILSVLAFVFSFYGIVDFLSFFPFYLPLATPTGVAVFRLFRVFRIFRLFKINAQFDAFNVIVNVINQKKMQLISSVVLILMIMLSASMLMYGVEHEAQPEVFENALSGFWWSMATIFTIGYGDIYPVTSLGQFLALIISFLGVGVIAIPTGIISAGFVEQFQKLDMYKGHGEGHELQFVTGSISEGHAWENKRVKEIVLPPQSLLVMVIRDDEVIMPRGDTLLERHDKLVIAAKNYKEQDVHLNEIVIKNGDEWVDKKICNIDLGTDEMIVMIKRNGRMIIPNGSTVIRRNDALVMYHVDYS